MSIDDTPACQAKVVAPAVQPNSTVELGERPLREAARELVEADMDFDVAESAYLRTTRHNRDSAEKLARCVMAGKRRAAAVAALRACLDSSAGVPA